MKKVISAILIVSMFLSPLTVIAQTAAQNQASAATLKQYNPNVNITSGNTYNGVSISGIGGAIASCTNIGGFLASAASNLLGHIPVVSSVKALFSSGSNSSAVATNDKNAVSALNTANKTTQCLDGVAYAVAKNTLAQITNKTLKWVNTGLNGNPLYVQNVPSYLKSISNQQVAIFLGGVQQSDPIFGNALRSSITFQLTGKNDGLLNVSQNTPQAQSYNAFQGDFVNGGWNALLNPAYNPITSFFNAVDTLNTNIASSQQNAQNTIQRGNGFLDLTHCTQYSNPTNSATSQAAADPAFCSNVTTDANYETCCTGQSTADSQTCNAYAQSVVVRDDGGDTSCVSINTGNVSTCCPAGSDSPMCVAYQDTVTSFAGQSTNTAYNSKGAGYAQQPVCTQTVTDTPGSIIAAQVSSITTSPTRQLEYANKINEVLGSFFDSFVNSLLSKGLRGSGGGPQVNFGLSADGDNSVANSTTTAGADLGYQSASSGDAISGDFDISRPQDLRAILQAQYDFLNRTRDAQIALERVIPAMGALDYCIPGPNPDYLTGLESNWQAFTSSIQQADPKNPSVVEKILNSLPVVGSFLGAITSLFTGSGSAPSLWSGTGVLNDKVTGNSIQVTRTFFSPSGHSDSTTTADLINGLNLGEQLIENQYSYYAAPQSTFVGTNVGNAFANADPNNILTVDGFLQDAYNDTDAIVGYNQTATTIDQQYDQNITDTQNDIEQMEAIRAKIDSIVATAKARYIAQRAAAGDPVNMQCIDQAYVIDTSPIVPVTREEPSNTPIDLELDAMNQHAIDASSHFYNTQIN